MSHFVVVKEWETKAGLKAAVVFVRGSHHCGYVEAPVNMVNVEYQEIESDVDVHGGVTYSGDAYYNQDIPWVFGYDCAHYNDLTKCPQELIDAGLEHLHSSEGIWRDEEFCIEQCESLAEQLMKLALAEASKNINTGLLMTWTPKD